jgi:hypothetical protein
MFLPLARFVAITKAMALVIEAFGSEKLFGQYLRLLLNVEFGRTGLRDQQQHRLPRQGLQLRRSSAL